MMLLWWTLALVVKIREARLDDSDGIAHMLGQSVTTLAQPYYQTDQIEAWCEILPPSSRVREMLNEVDRVSWVATVRDHDGDEITDPVAGYIDWKPNQNELDFLYVHPMYARQGVADQLYQEVLQEAQKESSSNSKNVIIRTFASEGARPFFEKQNFRVVERREFPIGNKQILIHNYKMELYGEDLPSD